MQTEQLNNHPADLALPRAARAAVDLDLQDWALAEPAIPAAAGPRQSGRGRSEDQLRQVVAGAQRLQVVGAGHSFDPAPLIGAPPR